VHGKINRLSNAEMTRRASSKGCRSWYVDAEELEDGCKDLILRERGSPEFEKAMKEAILERDNFREEAAERVQQAQEDMDTARRTRNRILQTPKAAAAGDEFENDDVGHIGPPGPQGAPGSLGL
jgi:hypothetical protein